MAMPLRHHRRLPSSPAISGSSAPASPSSPFCSFFVSQGRARSVRLGAGGSVFGRGALVLAAFRHRKRECRIDGATGARCSSAASGSGSSWWENWRAPTSASPAGCLSDVVWPSAGAFLAMALLGRMDQVISPTGHSFTIAPLGSVCAVLLAAPTTPGARKYNVFMAQIGCAAFGVLALVIFGPGWLARSAALAASIAFMIITRAIHPPAASLPILFIDSAKFHNLHFWYALFPGATGCILLCLIQELVSYLKETYKF